MTATEAEPKPTTDTWTQQLAQLKARYKHVRPPILAALNILLQNANISIDDAKAQAAVHGVKITAASVNAAKTLLSRIDAPTAATAPATTTTPTTAAPTPKRAPRRPRAVDAPLNAEALIKNVVAKLQTQNAAEADRLRDGIRRAIGVLQSLVVS